MFRINPLCYTGVTVLPSEIVEKHLKLASAAQLKVILYAFSDTSKPFDADSAAQFTGIKKEEAEDALSYWRDTGFILFENDEVVIKTEAPEKNEAPVKNTAETVRKSVSEEKIPHNNPSKLTYDEICIRIGESESVRILLNEAQMKLGRTIGTGDQSSLILLHDYYGLPVEVILTICEYARTKGKSTNMNYIYRIGVDWSRREIDTIDAADEELKNIEKNNAVWSQFCSQAGIASSKPTSAQEKYLSQWSDEWKFTVPMLVLAYEEMKTHTEKISYSYMHKVLSSWHMKNIDTPEKVVDEQEKFMHEQEKKASERQNKKKASEEIKPDPTASYDILEAERRARTSVPKSTKRRR